MQSLEDNHKRGVRLTVSNIMEAILSKKDIGCVRYVTLPFKVVLPCKADKIVLLDHFNFIFKKP